MIALAKQSAPPHAADESVLWERYLRSRSVDDRNALVMHHHRLAWAAIHRAKLPPHVHADDISGVTMQTLIWCVERFDPERGAKFSGWATQRLQGAIKDYLRGWSRAEGYSRYGGRRAHVGRLNISLAGDAGEHQQDIHVDRDADAAMVQVDAVDTVEAVAKLLPDRMGEIMRLRYVYDMTMGQIGTRLGLSESRTCQIHGEAMKRLQGMLREQVAVMVR